MSQQMQKLPLLRFSPILLLVVFLAGCEESEPRNSGLKAPEMPFFEEVDLVKGRSVWMGTCRNCHLMGVSNAPAVTDSVAWNPRINKGRKRLYGSALKGIRDEAGKYRMPPRGGNPRLSDEQVRLAVDFMIASVNHFAAR